MEIEYLSIFLAPEPDSIECVICYCRTQAERTSLSFGWLMIRFNTEYTFAVTLDFFRFIETLSMFMVKSLAKFWSYSTSLIGYTFFLFVCLEIVFKRDIVCLWPNIMLLVCFPISNVLGKFSGCDLRSVSMYIEQ